MTVIKGRSSDIISDLLGNIKKYTQIMEKWVRRLEIQYPNPKLAKIFHGFPEHIITILPMAFCDSLTKDLDGNCNEDILAAIGLNAFLISTHDDVVDEMPKNRETVSSLIYAGNIAGLEGMKILFKRNIKGVALTLINSINQNHYLQQLVIEKLWQNKEVGIGDYFDGIKHICTFSAIGPLCALALTKKTVYYKDTILNFSAHYGFMLQLIDDIREVEEDKLAGYTSLPLIEGVPFTKSFTNLYRHAELAKDSLDKKWKRMRFYVDALEKFAKKTQGVIDGTR